MWTGISINSVLIPAPLWESGNVKRPDDPPLVIPSRDALELETRRIKADRQSGALARAESLRYFTVCERIQGLAAKLSGQPGVAVVAWHGGEPGRPAQESAAALLRLLSELGRPPVPGQIDQLLRSASLRPYRRFRAVFHPPESAIDYWQSLETLVHAPTAQAIRDRLVNADVWDTMQRRLKLLERVNADKCGLVDVIVS